MAQHAQQAGTRGVDSAGPPSKAPRRGSLTGARQPDDERGHDKGSGAGAGGTFVPMDQVPYCHCQSLAQTTMDGTRNMRVGFSSFVQIRCVQLKLPGTMPQLCQRSLCQRSLCNVFHSFETCWSAASTWSRLATACAPSWPPPLSVSSWLLLLGRAGVPRTLVGRAHHTILHWYGAGTGAAGVSSSREYY